LLVCYTDGVTEATRSDGVMFGKSRLRDAIIKFSPCHAEEIASSLLSDIARFVGESPQYDDITLLLIKKTR
ncbi:MAG: SpoIIE family protein phosphatase, partial [Methanospirillum sp.]|uniref:PP2C family protein-serine/threonine phosphatase n=1 Tax=Methanospirillum sp. TaxID=45200 RepID=UPI0023722BB9